MIRKNAEQDLRMAGAIGAVIGPMGSKDNKGSSMKWFSRKNKQLNY